MNALNKGQVGNGSWFIGAIRWALGMVVMLVAGCGGSFVVGPQGIDVQIPMTLHSRHVVVDVRINGEPARFLLDTGASHNTVTEKLAARLQLRQSETTATGSGAGANFEARWVGLDELSIGAESILASRKNQIAFIVPVPEEFVYDGILGAEIWRRFTVTLDYGGQQIYLEPNAALEEPFQFSRGGLVMGLDRGQFRVLHLFAGGPADQAGVVAGDALVSLNGMPQNKLDSATIQAALLQSVGTQVALQLRDAQGKAKSVTIVLEDLL